MKKTITTQDKLNEFYKTNGNDVGSYSPEAMTEFTTLVGALKKEASKVDPKEKEQYETLCKTHGIKVSDKFRGWDMSERRGKKNEDGTAGKVTQIVVGLKYEIDDTLFHHNGFISPKEKDLEAAKLKVQIAVARALAFV